LGGHLAVPIDVQRLIASVRFDVVAQVADVRALVEWRLDGPDGYPVFDLRQPVAEARFDGRRLTPDALGHRDMGAGHDARMRVVDVRCDSGGRHNLELGYRLGTPEATGAMAVEWLPSSDGVRWDLWMSDLEPGRYLEMWFPASLCHDALEIELQVQITGSARPHLVLANGLVIEHEPGLCWTVRYPAVFTSLSPLLVLAPADQVELKRGPAPPAAGAPKLTVASLAGTGGDLTAVAADAASWLGYFSARYGPWAHGDEFLAVLWAAARGMEYDGATTASETALEHEIFHSWFGRGVKPASAGDGWMDEAMATWATASRRSEGGRYPVQELGLDEPPALLRPPHPWSRHTPREAYASGARLLAGVAHMAGGPGAMRSALADWHRQRAGRLASSEHLAQHLGRWCERDLSPWWDRYVYGGEPSRAT
jgi:hypothetical protein